MKIGFVQFAPVFGNVDATLERLSPLLDRAGEAELLVLPELANSGYAFRSLEEARKGAEEIGKGPFSTFLKERCRDRGTYIVAGINERAGDRLYNSSVLVGPDGVQGSYRKLHLFKDEKDFFSPGDLGLPVFQIGAFCIGMLICFDWIFPEVWRILALQGADIIAHPANLVLPGLAQRAVPVHALTNRIFAVTANRIGTERGLTFTGGSLVADLTGAVLVEGTASKDHVGIVDIREDLARDKRVTDRNDIFQDRRPDQYTLLTHSV
jgi:predicted amidohydrolase